MRRAALQVDPERHVRLVEPLLLAQPLHPRADDAPLEVLGALVGLHLPIRILPLHVGVVGLIVRMALIIFVFGVVGLVRVVAVPPPAQIEGGAPRVSRSGLLCNRRSARGGRAKGGREHGGRRIGGRCWEGVRATAVAVRGRGSRVGDEDDHLARALIVRHQPLLLQRLLAPRLGRLHDSALRQEDGERHHQHRRGLLEHLGARG